MSSLRASKVAHIIGLLSATADSPALPATTLPTTTLPATTLSGSMQPWHLAWLRAVVARCVSARPDLATVFEEFTGISRTTATELDVLTSLTIAEIGMVYEALLATWDCSDRKAKGQFFTPDDAADFMARQQHLFPEKAHWLDPCCGVGNLAWHLSANAADATDLVKNRLTLVDQDPVALITAVCLLTADFAAPGDSEMLPLLWSRCRCGNFLDLAHHIEADFAIVNPPYAATDRDDRFTTAATKDLYAYFLERLSETTRGFISVTPASFLTAAKFASLRTVLDTSFNQGRIFVFDNVPDTLFRGFKFGSTNTSSTNFARATIMSVTKHPELKRPTPRHSDWEITPILRWKSKHRPKLFARAEEFLVTKRTGPNGEWAKVMPETAELFDALTQPSQSATTIADLLSPDATEFRLDIAATPRYFTSATARQLQRSSKHTLYFRNEQDFHRAYLLLNSSLLYWWWRCLDGGITLTAPKLRSLPVPDFPLDEQSDVLIAALAESEEHNLVMKLNAGKINENIKHPPELVGRIDAHVLEPLIARGLISAPVDFARVFCSDLFAPDAP